MSQIKFFRDAGLPLNEVSKLLGDQEKDSVTAVLLKQLNEFKKEIMAIKERQEIIVKILRSGQVAESIHKLDTEVWHEILTSAGINFRASKNFHEEFEKHSPEQHQQFLEALGFDEEEIRSMRQSSMI